MFGADPSHLSLLYFLTYLACANGLDPVISARPNFGGQELRVAVNLQVFHLTYLFVLLCFTSAFSLLCYFIRHYILLCAPLRVVQRK